MKRRRTTVLTGKRKVKKRYNGQKFEWFKELPTYNIAQRRTLRFIAGANFSTTTPTAVNCADILDTCLVATAPTVVYDIYQGFQLHWVKMWSITPPNNASPVTTVQCHFSATGGNNASFIGESLGTARPAFLKAVPPPGSQIGLWNTSTNLVVMQLNGPPGTIIDVNLTFVAVPGFAQLAQVVAVGATAGYSYYRGLDGFGTAATVLPPPASVVQI